MKTDSVYITTSILFLFPDILEKMLVIWKLLKILRQKNVEFINTHHDSTLFENFLGSKAMRIEEPFHSDFF